MTAEEHKETNVLFHKLWGLAHGTVGYVKADWLQLQAMIQRTQEACDPPCARCDERDQHQAEAEDGMRNAAEISGLM